MPPKSIPSVQRNKSHHLYALLKSSGKISTMSRPNIDVDIKNCVTQRLHYASVGPPSPADCVSEVNPPLLLSPAPSTSVWLPSTGPNDTVPSVGPRLTRRWRSDGSTTGTTRSPRASRALSGSVRERRNGWLSPRPLLPLLPAVPDLSNNLGSLDAPRRKSSIIDDIDGGCFN